MTIIAAAEVGNEVALLLPISPSECSFWSFECWLGKILSVKVSSNKYIVETLRSSIISGYTHLLTCIPLPYSLLLSFSSVNVKGMNESNISRRYTPPSTSKSCKLRRNLLKTVETPKRKGVLMRGVQ